MLKNVVVNLIGKAVEAAGEAHAPYSNFRVGAALLTSDDRIFTGCNVENASYGLTVCAERVAVFSAIAAGSRKFKAIAIVASGDALPYPCGACRQVLAEFCAPSLPVYIASLACQDSVSRFTLGKLLPHTFELKSKTPGGKHK